MKPGQGPWWWLLCFSAALRSGSDARPVQEREAGAAATKDDVAVLTFGVIQLTDTVDQVNKTTEAKVEAIGRLLTACDGWLWLLEEEARRAAEARQHVKEVLRELQVQMVGVPAQSRVTQDTLAQVEREDRELWTRVGNVEEHLDPAHRATYIKQLQEKAREHSDILRMLQLFTRHQRESLDGQTQHLSRLQQMVGQASPNAQHEH